MSKNVLLQVALDFRPEAAAVDAAVEQRLFAALKLPVPMQRLLVFVALQATGTGKVPSRT